LGTHNFVPSSSFALADASWRLALGSQAGAWEPGKRISVIGNVLLTLLILLGLASRHTIEFKLLVVSNVSLAVSVSSELPLVLVGALAQCNLSSPQWYLLAYCCAKWYRYGFSKFKNRMEFSAYFNSLELPSRSCIE
jgi:hypothetical protein